MLYKGFDLRAALDSRIRPQVGMGANGWLAFVKYCNIISGGTSKLGFGVEARFRKPRVSFRFPSRRIQV